MENENQKTIKEMIKCPFCSEEISALAKKCRFCGEWIDMNEKGKREKSISENNDIHAKNHPSYGTFTLLSLIIPIAGFIIGIVYMTKENLLDKKVGEHAIAISVLGCILNFIILSVIF